MNSSEFLLLDRTMTDIKDELLSGTLSFSLAIAALSRIKDGEFNFSFSEGSQKEDLFGLLNTVEIPFVEGDFLKNSIKNRRRFPKSKMVLHADNFGRNAPAVDSMKVDVYERKTSIQFDEWLEVLPGNIEEKVLTRNQILTFLNQYGESIMINGGYLYFLSKKDHKEENTKNNLLIVTIRSAYDSDRLASDNYDNNSLKEGDPYKRSVRKRFIVPHVRWDE